MSNFFLSSILMIITGCNLQASPGKEAPTEIPLGDSVGYFANQAALQPMPQASVAGAVAAGARTSLSVALLPSQPSSFAHSDTDPCTLATRAPGSDCEHK